jgi:hypothetical protein
MTHLQIIDKWPLTSCRLKVMDESSYQKDRLLGWICYRLDRLPQGLQLLRLRGDDLKVSGSLLLVEVKAGMASGSLDPNVSPHEHHRN